MHEIHEREVKFEVPDGWSVPDVSTLGPDGATVEQHQQELHTTYFDTEDYDLLRGHITLRRRTGDADEGWHLKIPAGKQARDEIHESLDDSTEPPAALSDLVVGLTGGAALRPIAILHTRRTAYRLADPNATVLLEVADDHVDATALGRPATMRQWREVEVELVDGDASLLKQAGRRLIKSGASESTSRSKLARALAADDEPPTPAAKRAGDSLHEVIGGFVREQCDVIVRTDVDLRRDHNVVHVARVGTRRLRSVLRVFAQEFDAERARALESELRWYGGLLGAVRDCQVLRERLRAAVSALAPEIVLGPVQARIEESLSTRERDARRTLAEARSGERYRALLATLRSWSQELPWVTPDRRSHDLADYLEAAERKVNKRLKNARSAPDPEEALHRARKAGKRARYVAELAEPVLGKQARNLVKRLKSLQDELGDLQDSVVATEFLRLAGARAGTTPGENGFTFGILWAQEQEAARMAVRSAPKRLG
ncbi:CHAD domain-containing protein [uncultured Jatrophihabitans sp.]|uniref:CYTH and CHAD domain-containing protein n=1 Tax=uncultured Jatrophihabitans sp. TaxID=1610747 RepID=UPI0035C94E8E